MKKILLIILILIITLFISSCTIQEQKQLIGNIIKEIQIIETGPEPTIVFCPKENCTKTFLDLIQESDEIKCVLYDLDIPVIIDALVDKNAEVYLEEDNKLDEFNYGYSYALMHNKFCIFDEKKIMTGSFNPTFNGANRNNNNIIIIESKTLVNNYLSEFNEIKNNIFGKGKINLHSKIIYNNYSIQNYFCPEDNCQKHVLKELDDAKESIRFMTFSFTDTVIADKLIEKQEQGIEIEGIMESKRTTMQYNRYNQLTQNGVLVHKDNNKYNLHHKVFIIDNETVITGSYNPTKSGNERNDENILIIKNKDIARQYLEEFSTLHSKS